MKKLSLSLFLVLMCALLVAGTINGSRTILGLLDASGATHTLPLKVVANSGALPSSGCNPGELAIVANATLGQQIYQNSGTGSCVWTQQINSGASGRAWNGCANPGLGDGLNTIPSGTYPQNGCYNNTGSTVTITGISCAADNAGTTTANVSNNGGTALLTGAITLGSANTYVAGTQSGTTTLANAGFVKWTWVSDGTTKQVSCQITGTY